MKSFSFENLLVWDKSRVLNKLIFDRTLKFPSGERFGLTSQIRRSTISISSNIAEGSGRRSFKEKARFTEIAFSSALELTSQCILATDLEYLSKEDLREIRGLISEITKMLNALHKSQLKKCR